MALSAAGRLALEALEEWGLLLLQDAVLPNLVALIAGEPIRGSWWGHAKGKAIFRAARELEDSADAVAAKLLGGKVTFVYRRHFAALTAVGGARQAWQTDGLSRAAEDLLARVDDEGQVRAVGKPAKDLETRLLVFAEQVHTAAGAHAKELLSWRVFAARCGVSLDLAAAQGQAELEASADAIGQACGGRARLPWQ
jgi:hypothetical protein